MAARSISKTCSCGRGTRKLERKLHCRDAPPDMVVSLGSGYQRLFIIPSMNALIVRRGRTQSFRREFLRMVLGR